MAGEHDVDARRRRAHPLLEVDGAVDAHLPGGPEDHQRGRAGGSAARRRLGVDHVPRDPLPAPGAGAHLQHRHGAVGVDERLRHRPGDHGRRACAQHRGGQHLHLPHLRAGPVRAGHNHEPAARRRRGTAGLPGHPHPAQEGGGAVSSAEPAVTPTRIQVPPRPGRRRGQGSVAGRQGPWRRIQPVVAIVALPLYVVVITAGKSQGEALNPDLTLPTTWQYGENFSQVWSQGRVPGALWGSLVIMVPAVMGVLALGSLASWILARRSSKFFAALYALAISGIVLPPAVVTIVLLLRQMGLAGTAIGMIGVYMGMYMSTVIFFVTGFVRTIPVELEEAARVDGAGPLRVFVRIILPLLVPVLSTATILICLYVWNDVFYAFFVVGGRLDTLPLNLFTVASAGLYLNNWHLIFAYVVLMSLPLLVVFVVAQRKIISGITSGAVK